MILVSALWLCNCDIFIWFQCTCMNIQPVKVQYLKPGRIFTWTSSQKWKVKYMIVIIIQKSECMSYQTSMIKGVATIHTTWNARTLCLFIISRKRVFNVREVNWPLYFPWSARKLIILDNRTNRAIFSTEVKCLIYILTYQTLNLIVL